MKKKIKKKKTSYRILCDALVRQNKKTKFSNHLSPTH